MTNSLHLMRRGVVGALLAVLALSLWGTAPASAEDTAAIDHAMPTDGAVRLLVSVPGTDEVDLAGVRVTVDGKEVKAVAAAASTSSVVQRTSILAIDTSASMAGTRIAEAKKAALAYLAAVPANVNVGVLTFDSTVNLVVPPGLDRTAARAAVSGLRLSRKTALYDGVLGALKAAGPGGAKAGQRKILLLSDGKDTTRTNLSNVLAAIKKSGADVDVVSLQKGDEGNKPLNDIANAGKGTMIAATDPAALTAAFAKEADALARQLIVTAQLPAGSEATSANVEVSVSTSAQTFTATAYVPVRTAADILAEKTAVSGPQPVSTGPLDLSPNVMYGAVAAIAVGLLGLIGILAFGGRPAANQTLTEQISAYGVMSVPGKSEPRRDSMSDNPFTGQARLAAEKALASNKNLEARVAHSLEAAGMSLRPAEWLLMRAAIAVGGGLVGLLLASGNIVLGVLVIAGALFGPSLYLRRKRKKRLTAFSTGLADTLQLMSGSLSAGLSLAQSIDTIVREGQEPISGEFRRVVIETRLGVTLEDSLDGVGQRMESRDFEWVVMAIRIQREVGGNLAELLLTVAGTLREREFLRRHVKALSAEGRLSCYVLGGLPPGFLLYLTLSKPDYVAPLYTTSLGIILLIGMGLLLGVGMFWMTKVAKVDV
ncbi:MAG: type II secretion system F family protein [Marmoricola sp.]